MSQLSFFAPPSWTVAGLTSYLRGLLESDEKLQDLWVRGEVSNLRRPSSGHIYFTLKDSTASLRCVMWRSTLARQRFVPRDGEAVEIHGSISIYDADGQYQLYADLFRPAGEGALYQEFLRLKARLEADGLFAAERKRPIPPWPRQIGVVTSSSGAALRDILNTLRRRYPLAEVVLSPAAVQGEEAPPAIVAAIEALNRLVRPDVIILARGGGSLEDLWAFNDERVARAVAASAAPIISGIGHETDFTIADFASDLRAPTPTAAAELATPNRLELQANLDGAQARLQRAARASLAGRRAALERQRVRLRGLSPQVRIRAGRQRLDSLTYRGAVALKHRLELDRLHTAGMAQRLASLYPLAALQRGFALVRRADGNIVRQVQQVQSGETLAVQVSDGQFDVTVDKT